MHHVESLLGSLQCLQKLRAGARAVSYLMELSLSFLASWFWATEAVLFHLGQGHSQTPGSLGQYSQQQLLSHTLGSLFSHKLGSKFYVVLLSLSSR